MNRWILMSALALALTWAGSAFAGEAYKLRVDGLACPFCAFGIEKKLNSLENVEAVDVDLGAGAVIVTMKDGASLDEAMAKQAVKDAGFTLNGFDLVEADGS